MCFPICGDLPKTVDISYAKNGECGGGLGNEDELQLLQFDVFRVPVVLVFLEFIALVEVDLGYLERAVGDVSVLRQRCPCTEIV